MLTCTVGLLSEIAELGCRQCTPSSNSTTLESNKSDGLLAPPPQGDCAALYPLMPVVLMPSTKNLWKKMNTIKTGTSDSADMAKIAPQSVAACGVGKRAQGQRNRVELG